MNFNGVIIREDLPPLFSIYTNAYNIIRREGIYLHAMQEVFMDGPLLKAPAGRHDGYCCGIRKTKRVVATEPRRNHAQYPCSIYIIREVGHGCKQFMYKGLTLLSHGGGGETGCYCDVNLRLQFECLPRQNLLLIQKFLREVDTFRFPRRPLPRKSASFCLTFL